MTTAPDIGPLVANVRLGYEMGWSFTPLSSKRPTLKGWQNQPRETLEEALAWAAAANVGLRTGRTSKVVVIDQDPGADVGPLNLPDTVTVTTGRPGGRHFYFSYDGELGNSTGRLGPHIDVKADGGQVVFPGSVHPETRVTYAWADGHAPGQIEMAALPANIVEVLRKRDPPISPGRAPMVRPGKTGEERYAAQALRGELNNIHSSAEGNRNDTLNKAAFSLGTLVGGGCLDRTEVEDALRQAAISVGLSETEANTTIRSGIESGLKHPRQPQPQVEAPTSHDPSQAENRSEPSLPPCRFELTLRGNADRFVHLFGQDVHWCEERGTWYVWNGKCWRIDALREVHRMAEQTMQAMMQECELWNDDSAVKWAAKCNKDGKPAREMLEVVKHRRAILIDALDRHPWLLGVANGIINLRTGKLLPHNRRRLITVLSPASYDPGAQCPLWLKFLSEIMAGNQAMIDALQRLAGYFLTGDISVQILPIFYGPGGNGKNVFLDTIVGILGLLAAEAPDSLLTVRLGDEHPTEIADLHGKRLVVASEMEEGRKMRIGLVKKITGNKYLKGRFMRQDYFQFERTHKTVLVTNNKPIVTESSNAIWRRLRLIPFTVTIPESKQDKQLTEKLAAERPGILAWMVHGCLDWQRRKCDLAFPEAVQKATEEYRADSDHVADFIEERCTDWHGHEDQNMRTPKERVYLAYCAWCKGIGEDVLSRNAFNNRLRTRGFEDKPAKLSGDSKTQKCWLHLTLKESGYDA